MLKLPTCEEGKNQAVREIKLQAENHKVHVDRVKIVTHDGEQLDITVSKYVEVDKDQEWLSVAETPKCISVLRVIEDEKSKLVPKPTKTRLQIWGR